MEELKINDEARLAYNKIINIINKYKPEDKDTECLCYNYYNDDELLGLLKMLISLLKSDIAKLDLMLSKLAPYLIELLAPKTIIKIDKSYFNSKGLFHDAIRERIEHLVSKRHEILKTYVSVCTVYHFDRLIYLSRHFTPENTYLIASNLAMITASNSDYDDLVLKYAYEAIVESKNQESKDYLALVDIFTKYVFELNDLYIIKRSLDWLVKINQVASSDFYIGLAYLRYFIMLDRHGNFEKIVKLDSKLYEIFKDVRDMRRDSLLYLTYLYYHTIVSIMLKDDDKIFNSYQASFLITDKYLCRDNLSIYVDINNMIIDYYKETKEYLRDIETADIELDGVRGSLKAELNAEFFAGNLPLLINGKKCELYVADYYSANHHKYLFLSLLYNKFILAPILFESITENGNIKLKYIGNKKTVMDAHEVVMVNEGR